MPKDDVIEFEGTVLYIDDKVGQDELRELVHEFIFTNLVPGTAEQIGSYLDTFIARASSGFTGTDLCVFDSLPMVMPCGRDPGLQTSSRSLKSMTCTLALLV